MIRGVGFKRPRLYRETVPEQLYRHSEELVQEQTAHTLRVVRGVGAWLENRRLVDDIYKEPDCIVEVTAQCRLEGIIPEHIPAAVSLITDIYFGR